jgi:GntR family transcriptional regulator
VRQLAVDLAINPNTVVRAYRELKSAKCWPQQGTGTFITEKPQPDELARRRVTQLAAMLHGARRRGGTLQELLGYLNELQNEQNRRS